MRNRYSFGARAPETHRSLVGSCGALKRILDVAGAACALALGAPVIVPSMLAIRFAMGRPVLFVQTRPGYKGRPFKLIKLRTMRGGVDACGAPLPDKQRLTRLGAVLRQWSIDELPQFFNVLVGDMSLVGPRPLLMEYLGRYNARQSLRHEVKPGITGWAQVNGRNAISWEKKFELDTWYVENWSLWLDFKIVAMTIVRVFSRHGISSRGHVTMPAFQPARNSIRQQG